VVVSAHNESSDQCMLLAKRSFIEPRALPLLNIGKSSSRTEVFSTRCVDTRVNHGIVRSVS